MSFTYLFDEQDLFEFTAHGIPNIYDVVSKLAIGAGDLATGPYKTGLTRGNYSKPFDPFYVPTHTMITDMYNNMVNATLPVSILEFPSFFSLPPENTFVWQRDWDMTMSKFQYECMQVCGRIPVVPISFRKIFIKEDKNIKDITNMLGK